MSKRPRVAICHVCMGRGGSESKVMWAIQALKEDYSVTLVTSGRVGEKDLAELNEFYGTGLNWGDFQVLEAPMPPLMRANSSAAALRGAIFQRFCRKVAPQFELLVNAYGPCDFGVPAIHCIADFSWDQELRRRFDPKPLALKNMIYRDSLLRWAYLGLCHLVSRPSGRNLFGGEDFLVMNSQWTMNVMRQRYGVENACVIYPPVTTEFPRVDWNEKENGFVYIGRIDYEKRLEIVIEILSRVRQLGHDIHLHVIGQITDSPYGRMVRRLCEVNRSWVVAEGRKSGPAKAELLAKHRLGINARGMEAFGISVAEMVAAGCITFVPNNGGQVEIVDNPALCFADVDDAVKKIDAVLRDPESQARIMAAQAERMGRFSPAVFMREFRSVVEAFAKRQTPSV